MRVDGYSFPGEVYERVIVIRDEDVFFETLAANPNMKGIIGADEHTRESFPGVYIAGVMASSHRDYNADRSASTQKQCE